MAIKHEKANDRSMSPGNWVTNTPIIKLVSGKSRQLSIENGNYHKSRMGVGTKPGYIGPMYMSPLEMFPEPKNSPSGFQRWLHRGGKKREEKQGLRPWLFGNWWRSEDPAAPLQLIGIGVRLSKTPNIEDGVGNSETCLTIRGSLIRVRTDKANIIPGRIRTSTSDSNRAISRCEDWLQWCNEHHDCAPPPGRFLPTRVLDVSVLASDKIRLLETAELVEPSSSQLYASLSHSWGTSHRVITKTDNLSAHKDGIEVASLPKTFQQAITITQILKLRYLWIDSLCIVQDDPEDWEREAAKMGEVYANSHVTIAADSSTDDSSGCFTTFEERIDLPYTSMDSRSLGRPTFANAAVMDHEWSSGRGFVSAQNVAVLTHPGPGSFLFFSKEWMPSSLGTGFGALPDHPRTYKIGQFGHIFDPVDGDNLSSRGWTLQERFLAPRTLHFTAGQIFWECQSCMLAEEGSSFPRVFPSLASFKDFRSPSTAIALSPLHHNSFQEHARPTPPTFLSKNIRIPFSQTCGYAGEIWLDLVERFSERNLTYGKDKLPAISGLARTLSSFLGEFYYAGIWRNHILSGLNWQMYVNQPFHLCDNPAHDREIAKVSPPFKQIAIFPEAYRSPSWSWASVDGKIEFQDLDSDKLVAEVVECVTVPTGIDQFGAVRSGHIKLYAPIVRLRLGKQRGQPGEANYQPLTTPIEPEVCQDTSFDHGGAYFDTDPEFPCDALFLDDQHALLLRCDLGGQYTRIGRGWMYGYDLSLVEKKEVVII